MIWFCPVCAWSGLVDERDTWVGGAVTHREVLKSQQQTFPAVTQGLPHILQHKNKMSIINSAKEVKHTEQKINAVYLRETE